MSREKLHGIITYKNGKPDRLAIELYLEIKFQVKKGKKPVWETNYQYLVKTHKVSKQTIRLKLVLLEKLNLIRRELTATTTTGELYSAYPYPINIYILSLSLVNNGDRS